MKNLYVPFFIFFSANLLYGQRVFVNLTSGYGFDLAPETFSGGNISYTDPAVKVITSVNHSFGKGYNLGIGAGVHLTENIALGVEANYLSGVEETLIYEIENFKEERVFSSEMFRFIPQFRLVAPVKKTEVYADIGFAIGINPVVHYRKRTVLDSEETGRFRSIYTNGSTYGLKSSFGLKYQIAKNLCLSGEFRVISQSHAPERRQLLEAYRRGEDVLALRTTSDIHTIYVDEFVEDENVIRDPGLPSTELKFYFPFSSFGANLGVEYAFTLAEKIQPDDILK